MNSSAQRMGIFSGICLSFLSSFTWQGIAETVLLAILGAVVSFVVSKFLQWLFKF